MKLLIQFLIGVTLFVVLIATAALARPGHSTWGRTGGTFGNSGGGGALSGNAGGNTCSNALIFTLACNSQYAPLGLP